MPRRGPFRCRSVYPTTPCVLNHEGPVSVDGINKAICEGLARSLPGVDAEVHIFPTCVISC